MGKSISYVMQQLIFNSTLDSVHQNLYFSFEQMFEEENYLQFTQAITDKWLNTRIIEHVLGADRVNIRIEYKGLIYVLNFEFYSQSCWLESEAPAPISNLEIILSQLNG